MMCAAWAASRGDAISAFRSNSVSREAVSCTKDIHCLPASAGVRRLTDSYRVLHGHNRRPTQHEHVSR